MTPSAPTTYSAWFALLAGRFRLRLYPPQGLLANGRLHTYISPASLRSELFKRGKYTMSALSLLLNVLWIIFGGLWMSIAWIIAGIIMAITIVGLPWTRAA